MGKISVSSTYKPSRSKSDVRSHVPWVGLEVIGFKKALRNNLIVLTEWVSIGNYCYKNAY